MKPQHKEVLVEPPKVRLTKKSPWSGSSRGGSTRRSSRSGNHFPSGQNGAIGVRTSPGADPSSTRTCGITANGGKAKAIRESHDRNMESVQVAMGFYTAAVIQQGCKKVHCHWPPLPQPVKDLLGQSPLRPYHLIRA